MPMHLFTSSIVHRLARIQAALLRITALVVCLQVPASFQLNAQPCHSGASDTTRSRHAVFIDPRVAGGEQLTSPDSRIVRLSGTVDAIDEITATLEQWSAEGRRFETIDIVTHGQPGALHFAHSSLNALTLEAHRSRLATWKNALQPEGGVRLFACRVTETMQGRDFLQHLSEAIDRPAAASIDVTGPSRLGGNWVLETTAGGVLSSLESPFDVASEAHLQELLGWSAGDVVFLQIENNGNSTALLKFATLVPIKSGDSFVVTDRSWISPTPSFTTALSSEGSVTLTAQSNIPAGQIFTINVSLPSSTTVTRDVDSSSAAFSFSVSGWTGSSFTLTSSGDNAFIYTGSDSSPTFLFGLLFTTVTANRDIITGWSTSTTLITTSLLPSGLTSGTSALALNYSPGGPRRMAYTGATSATDRNGWLARIGDSANWTSSSSIVTGSFGTTLSLQGQNTTPTFIAASTSLTFDENSTGNSLKAYLHVSDSDSGQTLTWSQSSAPSHGMLSFSGATASSGSTDITPGGTITYTPTAGYIGSDGFQIQVSDGVTTTSRSFSLTVVDNAAPTITLSQPSSAITATGPITYTLTYADTHLDTISLTAAGISVNTTGTAAAGSVSVTGSGTTRTVTLGSLTGNGTLAIQVAAGTARDTSGNTSLAAGPSTAFTVDSTKPTLSIGSPSTTLTGTGPVDYEITYSDANLSGITLAAGDVIVNSTGTATASVDSVTGSGNTRTVRLSSISGDGTLGISIASGTASDTAGNLSNAAGPSSTANIDNTPPSISSIVRLSPTSASTTLSSVVFQVTFSEAVSHVDVSDFALVTSGVSGTIQGITWASSTQADVAIDSISGTGSLRLDVDALTTDITDLAGNAISGGYTGGETFTVAPPNAAPTLSVSVGSAGFVEGSDTASTAIAIDPGIQVTDSDSTTLAEASIALSTAFVSTEDTLAFVNDGLTMGNIAGTYNATNGVLALSSSGATATLEEWQNALRTVTYLNNSDAPDTTTRTVEFSVSDGIDSSAPVSRDIAITASNDSPSTLTLSASTVLENQSAGEPVGLFSSTDPDTGDTAAYSFASGAGDDDNASFTLSGNQLQTAAAFDRETKPTYSIRLKVTDANALTREAQFTITVLDVNEAPVYSSFWFATLQDTASLVYPAKILARWQDPEGLDCSISRVDAVSSQGGTIEVVSSGLRYAPPPSYLGADTFTVDVTDGTSVVTGSISITVQSPSSAASPTLVVTASSGSDVSLKFAGIPGRSYKIQHTSSLPPTSNWTTLTTVTANSSGFVSYTHVSPPSPSYWRTVIAP